MQYPITFANAEAVRYAPPSDQADQREARHRKNDQRVHTLAEVLGITPQDVASAMFADVAPRSLEESVFDDDDSTTLGSLISDESEADSFDKLALRMAIETLDERRRQIIYLRYFKDYSQSQTAKILGLSQVKISREEKKIIEILRKRI